MWCDMKLTENGEIKAGNNAVGSNSQPFVILFLKKIIHLISHCQLCLCISCTSLFFSHNSLSL